MPRKISPPMQATEALEAFGIKYEELVEACTFDYRYNFEIIVDDDGDVELIVELWAKNPETPQAIDGWVGDFLITVSRDVYTKPASPDNIHLTATDWRVFAPNPSTFIPLMVRLDTLYPKMFIYDTIEAIDYEYGLYTV